MAKPPIPAKSTAPTGASSAKSPQPAKPPVKSAQAAKPAKAVEPSEAVKSVKPAKSAKSLVPTRPKILVLAIDGGGIRGIIPAYILSQLEELVGKRCYQLFDIIGGTSTGGIISIGLTTPNPATPKSPIPFTAAQLLTIYQTDGSKIFLQQDPNGTTPCATYYADNGNEGGVEPFLQNMIGNITLSHAYRAVSRAPGVRTGQVFTTGYIVSKTGNTTPNPVLGQDYGPYLFNWRDAAANPLSNYCAWEAARATSAAPVYFPVAHVGGGSAPRSSAAEKWVVDGGTMSNNPAMWGITEALRRTPAAALSDIVVVSVGTGEYTGANGVGIHTNTGGWTGVPDDGNWSQSPWMLDDMYDLEANLARGTLLTVVLSAVQLVTNSQLKAMQKAGLTYYRLEPSLPDSDMQMDNVTSANIDALTQVATEYIASGGPGYVTFNEVVALLKGLP